MRAWGALDPMGLRQGSPPSLIVCLLVFWMPISFEAGPPGGCLISSLGKDGVGHRVSSDVSCIVVSHELGLQWVHRPWHRLEHIPPDQVPQIQAFLGFYDWYPRIEPHMKVVPRAPGVPSGSKCHVPGWLDSVADRANRTCATDHVTVYDADNCWDRFFCTTLKTPVLQNVLHGLWARVRLQPALAMDANRIHVAIHIRRGDLGLRRWLDTGYYSAVADGLVQRHERYLKAHPRAGPLGLKFWVHTDTRNLTFPVRGYPVEIVYAHQHPLIQSLQLLLWADVLVQSISSMSDMVALLGGGACRCCTPPAIPGMGRCRSGTWCSATIRPIEGRSVRCAGHHRGAVRTGCHASPWPLASTGRAMGSPLLPPLPHPPAPGPCEKRFRY